MKYANRYGDQRATLPRVNDYILKKGTYYKILDVLNAPSIKLDLTPTGTKVNGYLSAGSLAAGTLAVPIEGTKISPTPFIPFELKRLAMGLMAVLPQKAIVGGAANGIPIFTGGANTSAQIDISCEVRYFNPKESPMWLTPDGKNHATIDHIVSPPEDPSEFFPVFAEKDDTPFFQAINKNGVICGCVVILSPVFNLVIEEVKEKPSAYFPIADGSLPMCRGV
jgi:hypothetical protein